MIFFAVFHSEKIRSQNNELRWTSERPRQIGTDAFSCWARWQVRGLWVRKVDQLDQNTALGEEQNWVPILQVSWWARSGTIATELVGPPVCWFDVVAMSQHPQMFQFLAYDVDSKWFWVNPELFQIFLECVAKGSRFALWVWRWKCVRYDVLF